MMSLGTNKWPDTVIQSYLDLKQLLKVQSYIINFSFE